MKRKIGLYLSIFTGLLVIFSGAGLIWFKYNSFNHLDYLASAKAESPEVFAKMRKDLPDIIATGGVRGALLLAGEAFRQEVISMYECHTFSHLVGHYSSLNDEENIKIISDFGANFCEGGFKHGLESQIVLEGGPMFREKLYHFCDVLQGNSYSGCYHGAGHTFMRQLLDAQKALDMCNTLTGGPVKEVRDCYQGVFSEYTNLAGGVDGETGLAFSDGPAIFLKNPPMDTCAALPAEYQVDCALELNGLGLGINSTPEQVEKELRKCISGKHRTELKAACLRSVSAVAAQHELPRRPAVTFFPFILGLEPGLRRGYIDGVATETKQFIINGVNKDWQAFCNHFSDKSEYDLCTKTSGQ